MLIQKGPNYAGNLNSVISSVLIMCLVILVFF